MVQNTNITLKHCSRVLYVNFNSISIKEIPTLSSCIITSRVQISLKSKITLRYSITNSFIHNLFLQNKSMLIGSLVLLLLHAIIQSTNHVAALCVTSCIMQMQVTSFSSYSNVISVTLGWLFVPDGSDLSISVTAENLWGSV